jgi:cell division protein FtsW (lipid II flippase)
MIYCIAEIFNPEARSMEAWVYAVRGLALYMMLTIPLTLLYANKVADLDRFIKIVLFLSIIAALWGLRQFFFGPDAAETTWLNEGKNRSTHVLFGVLRVFSFFSDAGQFGAGIAQSGVIATVIFLGPFSLKTRCLALLCAFLFFFLMIVSGTRGALIVPVAGMLSYLFASKNFKLLVAGLMVLGATFVFLKYTTIAHDIYQVRRMRTALDPNDASLQVRLTNRVIINDYLKDKPFGGGIGTSGSWGQRFTPGTLLAETPNDGWYVRVMAETGVVGFYLHLGILLYIGLAGLHKTMKVKDPRLRHKLLALFAGYVGIAFSSYGNPLLGQIPTGIILYMTWAYLFLAPDLDQQIKDRTPDAMNT